MRKTIISWSFSKCKNGVRDPPKNVLIQISKTILFSNTMQYNAIQSNTMQCNTMQYNVIQCNKMQYNAINCNTIQYDAMKYNIN